MDNNEISIIEALNQTQSWLNAGEYEKTIQACHEILDIEPGNQRALALLKQAEEKRLAALNTPAPEPEPFTEPEPVSTPEPVPTSEPVPTPEEDPLAKLMAEDSSEVFGTETRQAPRGDKWKHILAMVIPALLVVLIGGALIWAFSNKDRNKQIDDLSQNPINQELTYIKNNEQRVEDLIAISAVIEASKKETGVYPSVQQLTATLLASESFSEIPQDPRHGEIDKAGKAFEYMYAVYSKTGSPNSEYVLSALFEDSRGFGSPWTRGVNVNGHPDFRDSSLSHVTVLGASASQSESGPKVKVRRTQ